ncbi:MAG: ATP-dependent RNA helicase DeaD [Kiritimatiellia bacterium]|jgi:ATP-dependent RNA helicase DeaD
MSQPEDGSNADTTAKSDYMTGRKFVDFPLSRELLQGIHDHGYTQATPIQAATIEPGLAGRDILARAKTGTGKTAAFCIPIIEAMDPTLKKAQAIILAPTRELAQQISEEIEILTAHMDVCSAVLVGGMPMEPQINAMNRGAEIIVGTPGRVLDHIGRGNFKTDAIKVACLDEADEMVSMGFYEQVTKILKRTPDDRQVLLFSATISAQTGRLVRKFLNDPEDIILSTDEDKVEGIAHIAYEAPLRLHKARALMYIIDMENPGSAIVFCNTREDTNTVASFLDKQGHDVLLLSGELAQSRRYQVMKKVKAGAVRILVATDVASRGIDISNLTHVFNYSLPHDAKIYLHRTGRTGRIGKKGTAISLLSGKDISTRKTLESVHKIEFDMRPFPKEEDAVAIRVDAHAAKIRKAMGAMAFESYLPAVRAIMKRPDAELLFAVTMRGFFNWDRQRMASMSDVSEPDESTQQARTEERAPQQDKRKPRRDDDRKPRRDDDRKRGSKGDDRKRSERRDDDKRGPRKNRRDEPKQTDDLDLDDLLVTEDLDALLEEEQPTADAPTETETETDEQAPKKARKRRRKRKNTSADSKQDDQATNSEASNESSVDTDDLDALLSMD